MAHDVQEGIWVDDQYYILATAARASGRSAVLKSGDTFAVFDRTGDIARPGRAGAVSRRHAAPVAPHAAASSGDAPLLLSSRTSASNELFGADLTNPDLLEGGDRACCRATRAHLPQPVPRPGIRVRARSGLVNYSQRRVSARRSASTSKPTSWTSSRCAARGAHARGTTLTGARGRRDVSSSATSGLDDASTRRTVSFEPAADAADGVGSARYAVALDATREHDYRDRGVVRCGAAAGGAAGLRRARSTAARASAPAIGASTRRVSTSNEQFNDWIARSLADLRHDDDRDARTGRIRTPACRGSARPSAATASSPRCETALARPATRARRAAASWPRRRPTPIDAGAGRRAGQDPARDARRRDGGARRDAVRPLLRQRRCDAAVRDAGARRTTERTGRPARSSRRSGRNVERALDWIDSYGDVDGDGFVEYQRRTPSGLVQQGWKDSHDSVFHADGTLAEAPIALCEVQGYVYAALRGAAATRARARATRARGAAAHARRETLRERVRGGVLVRGARHLRAGARRRQAALPRAIVERRPLPVHRHRRARARAPRRRHRCSAPDLFSGWGIRTVGTREARYNPMSYHNGSVWPHDNAIVAAGLARYGAERRRSSAIAEARCSTPACTSICTACRSCSAASAAGAGEGPTLYPVACAPQAWAAGAVFLLLQACLGLTIDAVDGRVTVSHARLPEVLDEVTFAA